MAEKKADQVLVATESFTAQIGDEVFTVHRGKTRVRGDHPLVKLNRDYWEPVDLSLSYESATAAPGEKRGAK